MIVTISRGVSDSRGVVSNMWQVGMTNWCMEEAIDRNTHFSTIGEAAENALLEISLTTNFEGTIGNLYKYKGPFQINMRGEIWS